MMTTSGNSGERQNVTISFSRQVLKKARILAARRETSISGLLALAIESLVGEDEAYERSERQAISLLDKGFHMDGQIRASRARTFIDTNVLIHAHDEISNAFRIEDESRIGFWDALIVASALKSGAHRILSEDLNAGQTIAGIRIENPLCRHAK